MKWQALFSKMGWDLIMYEGMKANFFEGEEATMRESFWYGDFEEFAHMMSIKIASEI